MAGGLGTRLKDTVPDLPKCMAPVAGHPFLFYVIQYLLKQEVDRFIFSLGYKHEVVEVFLKESYPSLDYTCVIESKPLQTGGAIRLALGQAKDDHVLIMNGDTLFDVSVAALEKFHLTANADCSLALKPLEEFDRYGAVVLKADGRIISFEEKKYVASGCINGGIYLLKKESFLSQTWPEVFSFEMDYLAKYCLQEKFYGHIQDGYFIDIGIPFDFSRAQQELKRFTFPFEGVDNTWTLFLDRDGVINVNKDDSYVFNRKEFIFNEGTLEAIARLSNLFGRIIVVTNQRGIGRGLMTSDDLEDIHAYMRESVVADGGRIDDIFYCTSVDNAHPDRKPNPGMGWKAKKKYPEIDLSKSIVIGDKASDMKLGRNLGAKTVLISSDRYKDSIDGNEVDLACSSLVEFARYFE